MRFFTKKYVNMIETEQLGNGFDSLLENQEEIVTNDTEPVEKVKEETSNESEKEEEKEEVVDYSDNSLYSFLQEKGITDPSKIKFTNEDNSVEEIDFNSLNPQEQLEILKEVSDPGLTEDEIYTINYLRQNGVTFKETVDYFANKKLEDYLNEHPEEKHQKSYTIDDYSDDDLFLVDLKQRYPEFTDEELMSELDSAKLNEELFKKKADALRENYKKQEDEAEKVQQQKEQQQVEDLRTNLMNAASKFNEIQLDYTDSESDSLVVEERDKQQMMSYILDQDDDGKSALIKDLEDPNALIELAWLRMNGREVLSTLTKHWKGLLAEERATNKKLQSEIDKLKKTGKSAVVVNDTTNESKTQGSIWDNSGLI